MFEALTIQPRFSAGTGLQYDLGLLAESLLFYGSVRLIADHNMVSQLLSTLDHGILVELLQENWLQVDYVPDLYALRTYGADTDAERFDVIRFIAQGREMHTFVPEALKKVLPPTDADRVAAKLLPLIREGESPALPDFSTMNWSTASIHARTVLKDLAPSYQPPDPLVFNVYGESMITVETNIDFAEATKFFKGEEGRVVPLSRGDLLLKIAGAVADLKFAAGAGTDVLSDPSSSTMQVAEWCALCAKVGVDSRVSQFQECVLENAHAIRDAVNAGNRTFEEFFKLLAKARKFREWLAAREPNADLVQAYYKAISEDTWLSKLAPKTARWMVLNAASTAAGFALAGAPGILAGLGIGLIDSFLVDKYLSGWRPNQFVSGPLKKFTARSDEA